MFNENELHVLLMFLRLAATAAVAFAPLALLLFGIKVALGARGASALLRGGFAAPRQRAI